MLTNSRDIIRRLEREGWTLDRVTGSHHVFKSPASGTELKADPEIAKDLATYMVALIELPGRVHAAE